MKSCPDCGGKLVKVGDALRCVACTFGWPWHLPAEEKAKAA